MSGSRSYPTSDASEKPEPGEIVLSLKTVQKMLPLVRHIATDIIASHLTIDRLQPEEERLDRQRRTLDWPARHRRYEIKEELAKSEKEREVALNELRELGLVLLHETQGRIGFPTMVNNRRAYFTYQPTEEKLENWQFADEEVQRPIPETWLREISFAGK
jgi:hypothetical protein